MQAFKKAKKKEKTNTRIWINRIWIWTLSYYNNTIKPIQVVHQNQCPVDKAREGQRASVGSYGYHLVNSGMIFK